MQFLNGLLKSALHLDPLPRPWRGGAPSPRHRSARHQVAGRCVDLVSRSHTVEFGEGGIGRRVRGKIAVAQPSGKADAPGAIRQSMNAKAVAACDARIDCMGSHLDKSLRLGWFRGRSGALTPRRSRRVHVGAGQRHVRSRPRVGWVQPQRHVARSGWRRGACAADPSVWRSQSMRKSLRGSEYQQAHASHSGLVASYIVRLV